ncbi:Ger(x)C family spore germination protein [Peribacillus muralis]
MKYLYMLFIILSISSIFFSQGDKHELNKTSFSFAIGIDYAKGGYEVSLQLINPGAISGAIILNNSPYIVYKATGKTIDSALEKISMNTSRSLDLQQEQVVLLGEELLRKGKIKDIIEYILHSTDIPSNSIIVTTKGNSARELLEIFSPIEGISSLEISNTLNKLGKKVSKTANDIKVDLVDDGKDIVVPYIELKGDAKKGGEKKNLETTEPTHFAFVGLALFKEEKLKSFMNYKDSLYLNLLYGKSSGFIIESSCPESEEKFAYKVTNSLAKKKAYQKEEDKYIFHYDLYLKGDISQYNCHLNLENPETSNQIEKQVKKSINNKIHKVLEHTKEHEMDPLGLGQIISQQDPKTWNKIKGDYPALLKNAEIKVNSHITIQNVGNYKSRGD